MFVFRASIRIMFKAFQGFSVYCVLCVIVFIVSSACAHIVFVIDHGVLPSTVSFAEHEYSPTCTL